MGKEGRMRIKYKEEKRRFLIEYLIFFLGIIFLVIVIIELKVERREICV